MYDTTQGPSAASGAALASLIRAHAAFYDPETPAESWGQSLEHQIELLGDASLRAHFPVVNGKLFSAAPRDTLPPWRDLEDLNSLVRVGLHVDVMANFVRARNDNGCLLVHPAPRIDQVFVAALNRRARGILDLDSETVQSKMRFLLKAAYRGTYAAAAARGTKTLYLTCVGGGVFHNPIEDIAAAMAEAHAAFVHQGGPSRIVLPLFPLNADVTPFVRALAKVGVRPKLVRHSFDSASNRIVSQSGFA